MRELIEESELERLPDDMIRQLSASAMREYVIRLRRERNKHRGMEKQLRLRLQEVKSELFRARGGCKKLNAALSECLEYKEALEWLENRELDLEFYWEGDPKWRVIYATKPHVTLGSGPTPLSAIRNAMGKGG